jgi:hypothetical protein
MARKPNFIYIGPDKAGSSWLHEVLLTHPQVFMPEAKDLYFFDRYYDHGPAWYLAHFAPATDEALVGEVCQDYLFHPEAAHRIRECLGTARFMVTLRDPADRAFSSYLYMLKMGERPGTFLEALEGRPELIEHGRYASGLDRFDALFGRDATYVAVFDDLVADPQAFIDGLLTWLGLDPMVLPPELIDARLPAAKARSVLLARAARAGAVFVRLRNGANVVGKVKRSALVHKVLYKPLNGDKPEMTDEERAAVHVALASEIAALDERFGLNLAQRWGWDTASVSASGTLR